LIKSLRINKNLRKLIKSLGREIFLFLKSKTQSEEMNERKWMSEEEKGELI
jgi:hypothetical protein